MSEELLKTRTGQFPIGFRDCLADSLIWARGNRFAAVDLVADVAVKRDQALREGIAVGAADLAGWRELITADEDRRRAAVGAATDFIRESPRDPPPIFLTIMLPEEPDRARRENFDFMVSAYSGLVETLEECDARLVIEGWPGPGAQCCTPETLRAFFKACPSERIGVNFDPSHLLRMGIDPIRFLHEFSNRVYHMHAKDTEFITENLYVFGHEQMPTFAEKIRHGAAAWRYAIPGHGCARWTDMFQVLNDSGYNGYVSIELEDSNFFETEDDKKTALTLAAQYLAGC